MIIRLIRTWSKEQTKQDSSGGSVWESNPPTTLHMSHNGFEVPFTYEMLTPHSCNLLTNFWVGFLLPLLIMEI